MTLLPPPPLEPSLVLLSEYTVYLVSAIQLHDAVVERSVESHQTVIERLEVGPRRAN